MIAYLNSFWNAGFWSFFLVGLIAAALRFASLDFDTFFILVAGIGFWVLLLTATRFRLIALDVAVAKDTLRDLTLPETPPLRLAFDRTVAAIVSDGLARTGSWFSRERPVPQEDLLRAFDEAEVAIQLWYMPLQALVWTLPALGFIGTAWKMRVLLGLLLGMMSTQHSLNTATIAQAAPYLKDALGIISFALALSAITYVAVTLVFKRDLESVRGFRSALKMLLVSGGNDTQPRSGPAASNAIGGR